jgi:malate dehydrogenase (oxaloacetate-decarboxylating)
VERSPQRQPNEGLDERRRYRGLIGVNSKVPIRDRAILSLVYTPGVAEACLATICQMKVR